MLHSAEPRRPADVRGQEADPWPLAIAIGLAVIGPFAVGIALAVLVALAS